MRGRKLSVSCSAIVDNGRTGWGRWTFSCLDIRRLAAFETCSVGQGLPLRNLSSPGWRLLIMAGRVWVVGLSPCLDIRRLAASETCSVGQVPALNPAKHRLGSTERALSYVNAQDLPPAFTLWSETSSASQILPLSKISDSCPARPNRSPLFP